MTNTHIAPLRVRQASGGPRAFGWLLFLQERKKKKNSHPSSCLQQKWFPMSCFGLCLCFSLTCCRNFTPLSAFHLVAFSTLLFLRVYQKKQNKSTEALMKKNGEKEWERQKDWKERERNRERRGKKRNNMNHLVTPRLIGGSETSEHRNKQPVTCKAKHRNYLDYARQKSFGPYRMCAIYLMSDVFWREACSPCQKNTMLLIVLRYI